jgi:glycosyltransferase involved in cell wall biosynthesis
MPAVVLEAGLLGLPVVATRVGGVPECVLDGETGLVVDQHDAQSLVRGLVDLLRQPERRASIGRAARTWIERNFTMSRVARQYAEFYQQVLVG